MWLQPVRRLASPPVLVAAGVLEALLVRRQLRQDVKVPTNVSAVPSMLLDPRIWLGIGGILLLERWIPARQPPTG